MASLLRHRVVKPMKYFADIEAVARTVAVPGLSFSSLLVRLKVAVARIVELVTVPRLSSSWLLLTLVLIFLSICVVGLLQDSPPTDLFMVIGCLHSMVCRS